LTVLLTAKSIQLEVSRLYYIKTDTGSKIVNIGNEKERKNKKKEEKTRRIGKRRKNERKNYIKTLIFWLLSSITCLQQCYVINRDITDTSPAAFHRF